MAGVASNVTDEPLSDSKDALVDGESEEQPSQSEELPAAAAPAVEEEPASALATEGSLDSSSATMALAEEWRNMNGLNVYLMFSRAGSVDTREAILARSTAAGWRQRNSSTACLKEGGCNQEPCHALDGPPRCNYQPAGAVVESNDYGYCEEMNENAKDEASKRPCRYFTIMREPMERLISEYNYYCLDCEEAELFCRHQGGGRMMPKICPNVSIVEWARRTSNLYTRTLSPERWAGFGQYREKNSQYFTEGGFMWDVTEMDFQRAVAKLKADNMLAIQLETLNKSSDTLGMWIGDTESFVVPLNRERARGDDYVPTEAELKTLQEMNRFDIRLYEALQRMG